MYNFFHCVLHSNTDLQLAEVFDGGISLVVNSTSAHASGARAPLSILTVSEASISLSFTMIKFRINPIATTSEERFIFS